MSDVDLSLGWHLDSIEGAYDFFLSRSNRIVHLKYYRKVEWINRAKKARETFLFLIKRRTRCFEGHNVNSKRLKRIMRQKKRSPNNAAAD